MKTVIIGLGLIGGSIALDLKKRGFSDDIIGADNNKENENKALTLGLVDRILETNEAIKEGELIIVAIPVNKITEILPDIMTRMNSKAVITDVGSTKKDICKIIEGHEKRGRYVASHPMAGTENSGPEAALKDLFNDRTCIICDKEKSDADAVLRIEKMYKILGMRLVYMNPNDHDLHAAFVSHLSHITSFALANAVLEKEQDRHTIFDLAGGGFESTARLAKSSPAMWAPIFRQNNQNICEALDLYIKHIQLFKKYIGENNYEGVENLMNNANAIRKVLIRITN